MVIPQQGLWHYDLTVQGGHCLKKSQNRRKNLNPVQRREQAGQHPILILIEITLSC